MTHVNVERLLGRRPTIMPGGQSTVLIFVALYEADVEFEGGALVTTNVKLTGVEVRGMPSIRSGTFGMVPEVASWIAGKIAKVVELYDCSEDDS